MTEETWLPIAGYEGLYEVSDHGRVRSLDRLIVTRGVSRTYILPARVLKPRLDRDGYVLFDLYLDRKRTHKAHRLVLGAFRPRTDDEGSEVDDVDGDRARNHLINLRWATSSQNSFNLHVISSASGHRCVRYRPDKLNPWQAYSHVGGRFRSLGHFPSVHDAVQARKNYERSVGIS